jgi:hypothetical protein
MTASRAEHEKLLSQVGDSGEVAPLHEVRGLPTSHGVALERHSCKA